MSGTRLFVSLYVFIVGLSFFGRVAFCVKRIQENIPHTWMVSMGVQGRGISLSNENMRPKQNTRNSGLPTLNPSLKDQDQDQGSRENGTILLRSVYMPFRGLCLMPYP